MSLSLSLYLYAAILFFVGYLLNIFYITVLYHRGLAHGAVQLHPFTKKLVQITGVWITGIDPKAWACMHRLHHTHSDSPLDPHSPWNDGFFGVFRGQLKSYEKALRKLSRQDEEYVKLVPDLDFPVSWVNRKGVWWIPYALHIALAVAIACVFHAWILGLAYFLGIMSHPLQGWMVNSFAHRFGYQNYQNGDQSRNNTLVAWLVMGEGFQNNHHAFPLSAKFSKKWFEVDGGYALCWIAAQLNLLKIRALPKTRSSPPMAASL